MPQRLPPPAASFIREHALELGGRALRAGMDRPTEIEGWWLAAMWIADDDGIVPCRMVAPSVGPPPEPPLARLGPLLSGSLSGFVMEEGDRQQLRLRLPVPPDDEAHPWSTPLVVQLAVRWEPARAATLTPAKLADVALAAFRRAVEAIHRP
jgi:hypothetical protein